MPRSSEGRLLSGSIPGHMARLSAPMVVGILSVLALNLIDTWFIARLGTEPLAALGFVFPVVFAVGSLALGLGAGAGSLLARSVGRGEHTRLRHLATDGLIITVVLLTPILGLGLLTIDPLFRLMGAGPELLPLIRDYLLIWYPGALFIALPIVGNSMIRANGDAVIPSLVMVLAALINALLDPLLIFGYGPFPRLEMSGAALASVIARIVTAAVVLWILQHRERLLDASRLRRGRWRRSLPDYVGIALPAALNNLLEPLTRGIVTAFVAGYGAAAVAGFTVATRLEATLLIPLFAISTGLGPFVGQNWGAGQIERVHRALRWAFGWAIVWGVFVALLFQLGAANLARGFDPDPEVIAASLGYLTLVPITYFAEGIGLAAGSAWLAMGYPGVTLTLTAIRFLAITIPAAWFGGQWLGLEGIFLATALANLALGAMGLGLAGRLHRRRGDHRPRAAAYEA